MLISIFNKLINLSHCTQISYVDKCDYGNIRLDFDCKVNRLNYLVLNYINSSDGHHDFNRIKENFYRDMVLEIDYKKLFKDILGFKK